ncbi:hypothetical protein RR46_14870 [Papilio xuthus]|uniref:Uncharacterized protein n=1 Tax=Papilio xuthus TaxID=66420 RepID=A0A194PDF0_PAPXU|nr:hypothetical protein RR46_14870 [Papilio xuthus]
MQESRLRWYGHVRRMPPEYVGNLALQLSLPGRRSRGRPKTRWKDVVIKDMSECQVSEEEDKRAAGTLRCSTTPMDISNTRGTADALPAFEVVIRSLLEGP